MSSFILSIILSWGLVPQFGCGWRKTATMSFARLLFLLNKWCNTLHGRRLLVMVQSVAVLINLITLCYLTISVCLPTARPSWGISLLWSCPTWFTKSLTQTWAWITDWHLCVREVNVINMMRRLKRWAGEKHRKGGKQQEEEERCVSLSRFFDPG